MQPKMLESECPIFVEVDAADRIAARNAAIVDQGRPAWIGCISGAEGLLKAIGSGDGMEELSATGTK